MKCKQDWRLRRIGEPGRSLQSEVAKSEPAEHVARVDLTGQKTISAELETTTAEQMTTTAEQMV